MSNFQIHQLSSGAISRNSNIIHDTEVNGVYGTKKALAGDISDLASMNVAAAYDSATTYAIGQYCLYEGNIYRCIAITTGAFDATKWTQIVVTGEYRRVVELTSAQYAQLTPAEQNNGTIYIKTDEETTAADIPYAQGVSVADKLNSSISVLEKGTYTMNINGFFTANAGGTLAIVPHTSIFCAGDVTSITKGTVNSMTITLYDGTQITPTDVNDLSLQATKEITFTLAGSVGVRKMGYANCNLTFTLA